MSPFLIITYIYLSTSQLQNVRLFDNVIMKSIELGLIYQVIRKVRATKPELHESNI
jgi:hypothetical protein